MEKGWQVGIDDRDLHRALGDLLQYLRDIAQLKPEERDAVREAADSATAALKESLKVVQSLDPAGKPQATRPEQGMLAGRDKPDQ